MTEARSLQQGGNVALVIRDVQALLNHPLQINAAPRRPGYGRVQPFPPAGLPSGDRQSRFTIDPAALNRCPSPAGSAGSCHRSVSRPLGWHRPAPKPETKGAVQHSHPMHERPAAEALQPYNPSAMQSLLPSPILPHKTELKQDGYVTSQIRYM